MRTERSATLGTLFRSRRERGREGLPLLSVTMSNGLVRRESRDRKTETGLTSEEHLLVRKGDIAYNMMRMWQGSFGLAEEDGLVSPAYVVLAPTTAIDSLFAAYLFKTSRMLYLFWAYSYGLTDDRLRLYFKDFADIQVSIPPVKEQQRIARILTAWDRHIHLVEDRLAASERLKNGMMQVLMRGTARELDGQDSLLTPFLLGDLFTERVETNRPDLPLLSVTSDRGVIPRSADDQSASVDLTHYKRISLGDIGYNTMRMWQGISALSDRDGIISPAYTVCMATNLIDARFASYLFKYRPIIHLFYRHSQGLVDDTRNLKYPNFAQVPVAIPAIERQREISDILIAIDSEVSLLQRYRDALLRQKRALMQQLLGESRDVRRTSHG